MSNYSLETIMWTIAAIGGIVVIFSWWREREIGRADTVLVDDKPTFAMPLRSWASAEVRRNSVIARRVIRLLGKPSALSKRIFEWLLADLFPFRVPGLYLLCLSIFIIPLISVIRNYQLGISGLQTLLDEFNRSTVFIILLSLGAGLFVVSNLIYVITWTYLKFKKDSIIYLLTNIRILIALACLCLIPLTLLFDMRLPYLFRTEIDMTHPLLMSPFVALGALLFTYQYHSKLRDFRSIKNRFYTWSYWKYAKDAELGQHQALFELINEPKERKLIKLLRVKLGSGPGLRDSLAYSCKIYIMQRQYSEIIKLFMTQENKEEARSSSLLTYFYSKALYKAQEYDTAINILKTRCKIDPKNAYLPLILSLCFAANKNLKQALKFDIIAKELSGNCSLALANHALHIAMSSTTLRDISSQYEAPTKSLEQVAANQLPQATECIIKAQYILEKKYEQGEIPRFVFDFEEILYKETHAYILYKQGAFGDALDLLTKCITKDSNNAWSYFRMGLIYQSKGEYVKAQLNYKRSLNIAKEYFEGPLVTLCQNRLVRLAKIVELSDQSNSTLITST